MPVILNILPNVYWMYNNSNSSRSENDFKIDIRKNIELYNIKTHVDMDTILGFWNKSSSYINEIKGEIEKNEFSKLLAIYKKMNDAIKQGYLENKSILITNYRKDYLDVGLGIWIYFYHINAAVKFDTAIKMLSLKVIGQMELSDTLKKFFAFLNMNTFSISG